MKHYWEHSHSLLLANPSYSSDELARFQLILQKGAEWKSHIWLSTSGSTNQKWVGLSKEAILSSAKAVNEHLEATKNDCWINTLPEFHVGGLSIWARAYLSNSAVFDFRADSSGKWKADKFYHYVNDRKGTLSALVPAQIYDLIVLGWKAPPSLRAVIVGGGSLLPDLYEQAIALGWPILPSYGATECASQIATASLNSLTQKSHPPLILLSHIEGRVHEGNLCFSGASLLSTYAFLQNDEVIFLDPKREGWFFSDDRGRLINREIIVEGRSDSMVKILGENVDLAKLEQILQKIRIQLNCKFEVTLVGLPDKRLGQSLHMVCETGDQLSVNNIQEEFNRIVLPFERIRKVCLVESIPRSLLGKIKRNELIQSLCNFI